MHFRVKKVVYNNGVVRYYPQLRKFIFWWYYHEPLNSNVTSLDYSLFKTDNMNWFTTKFEAIESLKRVFRGLLPDVYEEYTKRQQYAKIDYEANFNIEPEYLV